MEDSFKRLKERYILEERTYDKYDELMSEAIQNITRQYERSMKRSEETMSKIAEKFIEHFGCECKLHGFSCEHCRNGDEEK